MQGLILAAAIGLCTYYNPGVMERVADYRGLECRECIGMVATLNCGQMGRQVWLARPSTALRSAQEAPVEGPFLVVDCAEKKHKENLAKRGLVAEVDWQTSRRWGMAGPVQCTLSEHDPAAEQRMEKVRE